MDRHLYRLRRNASEPVTEWMGRAGRVERSSVVRMRGRGKKREGKKRCDGN